jgi:hypothetical protein
VSTNRNSDRPPDPFDLASLRLAGDPAGGVGVKKVLVTVPVRKPDKTWFVRVHPDENYQLTTTVLEMKEENELYLVAPSLRDDLAVESSVGPRALFTSVSRQGVVFVWPCKLPGSDGRTNSWTQSALAAVERARDRWVRVVANMNLGAYEVSEATGNLPVPDWPDTPFADLLRIAFNGKFIDSISHPVLRRLRGEV